MSKPGGSNRPEQSFADVLNSLSSDARRHRGPREGPEEPPAEQLMLPWLPTSRPPSEQSGWPQAKAKPDVRSPAGHAARAQVAGVQEPGTWPEGAEQTGTRRTGDQRAPVQPRPVDPVPVDPVPAQSGSAPTVPVQPVPVDPVPVDPVPAQSVPAPQVPAQQVPARPVAEEWGEPEDFASAVRPYTWTRGRTQPVYELAVETLLSTSPQGRDVALLASVEHRAVAELCLQPRSVAEVAALLGLPLGVARVLLADMADIGLVVVHRTATTSGEAPEFGFMERVLSGLHRL